MKLCIDCKYWEPSAQSTPAVNYDKCRRPQPPSHEISYVTGQAIASKAMYADDERRHGACGREAIFFEPKVKESDDGKPF